MSEAEMSNGGLADEMLAFTERTAVRLSGVPARRLHDWAASELIAPSVVRPISERKTVRLYSFTDLVDLLVVAEMKKHEVPTVHVRRMLDYLRDARGLSAPLRQVEWAADGKQLYWREPDGPWSGGRSPDQVVISQVLDLEQIRATARRAAKERAGVPGEVEARRATLGSKPVFAGTRIPVTAVQAYLQRGVSEEEILQAYPLLEPADIETARRMMQAA